MSESILEQRLRAVEERLAMQEGLRASQDRDLSSIAASVSAQRHLMQALSITQSEHTETLSQHTDALRAIAQTVGVLVIGQEAQGEMLAEILRRLTREE